MNTLIWMCSGTVAMKIFEWHIELHGGSSSSGGLLGAAVGSSGGLGSLWIRTTNKNAKRVNKCQSDSRNGVSRLALKPSVGALAATLLTQSRLSWRREGARADKQMHHRFLDSYHKNRDFMRCNSSD